MSDCRKCRKLIPEALYDELAENERGRFDEHLKACPSCSAEFEKLKSTLEIMSRRVRRDPGQEFWEGYWPKLASRLREEEQKKARTRAALLPGWAYRAAGAVALVVLGVFLGRVLFFSPGREIPPPAGKETAEVLRAQNYFERSKVVLLALVNFNPKEKDAYGLDFPEQKRVSRELVQEAGYLKARLSSPSQKRLRELVSDLEVILLQIANIEQQNGLSAVELVRQGVDESGILFKINVSEIMGEAQRGGRLKGGFKGRDGSKKSST